MEKIGGCGRKNTAPAKRFIEQATGRELDVADGFCGHAKTRPTSEQAVFGVVFSQLWASDRVLAVGRTLHDEAVHVLDVPAAFHELAGEPIKQFRMRWTRGLMAEIFGCLDEADAEIGLPEAVHVLTGGGG